MRQLQLAKRSPHGEIRSDFNCSRQSSGTRMDETTLRRNEAISFKMNEMSKRMAFHLDRETLMTKPQW